VFDVSIKPGAGQDAVAQESEAGSSVHLSFEQLRFGVHAFGASVVVFEGDRGDDGIDVLIDASAKECTWGRSASRVVVVHSANRFGCPR
jgi:hypothetical protein